VYARGSLAAVEHDGRRLFSRRAIGFALVSGALEALATPYECNAHWKDHATMWLSDGPLSDNDRPG